MRAGVAPNEVSGQKGTEPVHAWLAQAAAFALTAALLKLVIDTVDSPYRGDPALIAGIALGALSDLALGGVLALPLLAHARPALTRTCTLLGNALMLGVAAGAFHAHAVLRYLPGRESLAALADPGALQASLDEHASLGRLALEVTLATLLSWVTARALEPRLKNANAQLRSWIAPWLVTFALWLLLPFVTHGQLHHGASQPLLHLLASGDASPVLPTTPNHPPPTQGFDPNALSLVFQTLGVPAVSEPLDVRFPYCRKGPRDAHATHPRNVILLILESVGAREAALEANGKPVMPQLARIEKDELAFANFYAAGDRSSQGMVGILSGISAETHRRILMHAPLVSLPSLPRELAQAGYRTHYLHGSDLSFEQQRAYLTQLGVAHIVEPTAREMSARIGWGLPDAIMFDKLAAELTRERNEHPETPYFATLFTLSTHDPYALPKGESTLLPGDSSYERFVNALSYTDRELGRFYDWYVREERPRGTLLLMLGDHGGRVPFPSDPLATSTGEAEYRFGVPFIVAGLTEAERREHAAHAHRLGGQLDVAQTTLGLLGLTLAHCHEGLDLLAAEFPAARHVVSLAGENLSFFYVHDGQLRWMWALAEQRSLVFDERADPTFRHAIAQESLPERGLLNAFLPAYFRLGEYLNVGDHFAPRAAPKHARPVRVPPAEPMLASHRARTQGDPLKATRPLPADNSLAAMDAAMAAGFSWLELDLQVTRDGEVILAHDPSFLDAHGQSHDWSTLTLAEIQKLQKQPVATLAETIKHVSGRAGLCLELKPQADIFASMRLVDGVMRALEGQPHDRIIIDSFSRSMLATFAALSEFAVGYDLPQKPVQDEWLDFASEADFDWVYVEVPFLNADVVQRAHARGLKVMAYTVNDAAFSAQLGDQRVDGIISDVAAPWALTPRP